MRVQQDAIQALSGYLTDEAAEVLLRGMGTATAKTVRDACRSALANIRSYEEERRLWAEHKEGRVVREDAVQQLLGPAQRPLAPTSAPRPPAAWAPCRRWRHSRG